MAFSEEKVVGAPSKMLGTAFFEVEVLGGKKLSKRASMSETYAFSCAMVRSSALASTLLRASVAADPLTRQNLVGELGTLEEM